MKKKSQNLAKKKKLNYVQDNKIEDRAIKTLERKLKLNKRKSKAIPKSFISDGLDYLLEICNEDSRKAAAEAEKQLQLDVGCDSDDSDIWDYEEDEKKNNKNKYGENVEKISENKKQGPCKAEKIKSRKRKISISDKSESDSDSNENSEHSCDNFEEHPIDDDLESDHISDSENEDETPNHKDSGNRTWEDIYGRQRDEKGNVVATESSACRKYIPPAARLKNLENDAVKSESLLRLRRQMKGLMNKLSESNMHTVCSQLEDMYMKNSRNDMNEMLSIMMMESIVAPVITPNRLVTEHMMCIAVLHANVGTEVGAHFILSVIKRFNQMMEEVAEVENKELDNIILMISNLYNFQVFGSQLIYQILDKLAEKFTEKEIELILLVLKTIGFVLRKDDPLALKKLILSLQQKAAAEKSSSYNFRIQFMLDVMLAIKNNNMNKIPQYDPSHTEHLKKILKNLLRKGNNVSQLNLTLQDLLNADERGKWWIVGSSWSGNALPNSVAKKSSDSCPLYSEKILELARSQRMNTDTRKNIFCILMTAEDYLDAFEKLHHLGLKNHQEREIVYVILNSCLQEKTFNPFYGILAKKFCEYDRKYHMATQFTLWDKFKILNTFNKMQLKNLVKFVSFLIIKKALPLSILKVIEFGELDKATTKFLKMVMLDILLHEDSGTCQQVFERIATSANLQHFREGLRLFIAHFLMRNLKSLTEAHIKLLKERAETADRILMTSRSKSIF